MRFFVGKYISFYTHILIIQNYPCTVQKSVFKRKNVMFEYKEVFKDIFINSRFK